MASLYRKYRPQNFSQILGQNHIKTTLQNEILLNKVAHAYLFCGPRAVGKTTLARVLDKAVNCDNRPSDSFEPCNECSTCRSINDFNNLDIIEIDAASNTGVDNVRDNIIALSRVRAMADKYRVFIIDEVHMLSNPAFNALLKTLEEPPAKVIFILCTTEVYKVPSTIISRCQRFDFRKISTPDMLAKLKYIAQGEKLDIDDEVLNLIARKSEGHLRDAESLLSQIIAVSGKKINLESASLILPKNTEDESFSFLEALAQKDIAQAIRILNELYSGGVNLKNFLNDLLDLIRKMILSHFDENLSTQLGLDQGEKSELHLAKIAKSFSLDNLMTLSQEFIIALKDLKVSSLPTLAIELAIIRVGQNIDVKNIKKIKTKHNSDKLMNNIQEIESRWPEFLKKIKPLNHSLSSILQAGRLDSLVNQELRLTLKYKFHQEKLESPEIKKIIEDLLEEVYQCQISLKVLVEEGLDDLETKDKNNNEEAINDLLKTFGGQVIS